IETLLFRLNSIKIILRHNVPFIVLYNRAHGFLYNRDDIIVLFTAPPSRGRIILNRVIIGSEITYFDRRDGGRKAGNDRGGGGKADNDRAIREYTDYILSAKSYRGG